MTRFSCLLAALLLPAGLALAEPPAGELPVDPYEMSNDNAGADPYDGPALYEAFGGEAGVGRVVDAMVDRSLEDPVIGEVLVASDLVRLRRTLKEQFCYILGGGCTYTGRDMQSSHKDLGLTNRELNALVENLQIAMSAEGVPFRAQNKLLAKLAPMQKDVVTR
jgi:hemoglobin